MSKYSSIQERYRDCGHTISCWNGKFRLQCQVCTALIRDRIRDTQRNPELRIPFALARLEPWTMQRENYFDFSNPKGWLVE